MNELQSNFTEVVTLIRQARAKALYSVNKALIDLYWQIGEHISRKVAESVWGKSVVAELANFIADNEPELRGFSDKNLWRMKQFYETYKDSPKLSPLVREISWTHNLLIFSKTKSDEEREFYLRLTAAEKLGKRELERQLNSANFERTMLANQKLSPVLRELPQDVTNVFKDTYVFEFLNLPEPHSENDLQKALLARLKDFILELGKDFIFMGEEYRLQVGNSDFFTDLLFYHRGLQCLVMFELKIEDFKPEFVGKLNFYLEALDRDVRKPRENPSIAVLLCKSKDAEVVEYAMSRNLSPALIADYETKFIDKKVLQAKLHELFNH
jgi:predicted nuclease of restriction endonuclease-like (RecB) superfamily